MSIDYEIVDSNKGAKLFVQNNVRCINLCSYFKKKDEIKILEADKQFFCSIDKLNLCNFASLCYKLRIIYSSEESHDLMKKIIDVIRLCNSEIELVQEEITNCMEVDSSPIEKLVKNQDGVLYINKIFRDQCNFIGFSDSQIVNLCSLYNNITEIVPKDLIERIPMTSSLSSMTYSYLKELMNA